jgi:hypothetical protein
VSLSFSVSFYGRRASGGSSATIHVAGTQGTTGPLTTAFDCRLSVLNAVQPNFASAFRT